MRRIFSPYIMSSLSNNGANLTDSELIIIFHQLRHLYLKNNSSNLISYNDTYTLQFLLKNISENHILFEKNFFFCENEASNGIIEIKNRKDKRENNKIYRIYNELLGRNIKTINRNDINFKSVLERYKLYKGEMSSVIDFEMNYYSINKSKDKFYRDYILKINLNDQKDIELRESFEKKNGFSTFRHLYKNFVGMFDNYRNLLSSIYSCKDSKIKVSPPEFSNIAQFKLTDNFFIMINFNNINLIDSMLDILFSINYSDLVYLYQGQNSEVLLGVSYSLEDEEKDQRENINIEIKNEFDKNNKNIQDEISFKNNKSFELYIKIRSDDSRLIIEDIISYCQLILAINTNSDLLAYNDKSIFKRLDSLEALAKMNSYTINNNFIKSNRANTPSDLKDFKLVYQKKLPYLEPLINGKDDGIDVDSLFKNEAIESIRANKNIFDLNKNYNSKSILNDIINNINEKNNSKIFLNIFFL